MNKPIMQIHGELDRVRHGLLISDDDRLLLLKLAQRDTTVSVHGWGEGAFTVKVQALLKQIKYEPAVKAWCLPLQAAWQPGAG